MEAEGHARQKPRRSSPIKFGGFNRGDIVQDDDGAYSYQTGDKSIAAETVERELYAIGD